MTISGRQVAGARGLLNWSQGHLAEAAGVGLQTIVRWEQEVATPRRDTIEKVRQAIEAYGVEFTNGGAPGVRFKPKSDSAESEPAGK